MNTLIDEIQTALNTNDNETEFLAHLCQISDLWQQDVPISILHTSSRMESTATRSFFKEQRLLNEQGETPGLYTHSMLGTIMEHAPEAIRQMKLSALHRRPADTLRYEAKRPKDKWKKIIDVDHIKASFDYVYFDDTADKCSVEFELRELIRRRKEVHALKPVGFIWMARASQDVSEVFTHYFKRHWRRINDIYYIGWSPSLQEINMRYFVCPPTAK